MFLFFSKCWLPFDWKNPLGYAIAAFVQYIMTVYVFLIATSLLCAGFECLLIAITLVDDLKEYLIEINENGKLKKNQSKPLKQFADFVQFHSLVIQLSGYSYTS